MSQRVVAPDRIWLQTHNEEWTWCEDQIEETDVEYVRSQPADRDMDAGGQEALTAYGYRHNQPAGQPSIDAEVGVVSTQPGTAGEVMSWTLGQPAGGSDVEALIEWCNRIGEGVRKGRGSVGVVAEDFFKLAAALQRQQFLIEGTTQGAEMNAAQRVGRGQRQLCECGHVRRMHGHGDSAACCSFECRCERFVSAKPATLETSCVGQPAGEQPDVDDLIRRAKNFVRGTRQLQAVIPQEKDWLAGAGHVFSELAAALQRQQQELETWRRAAMQWAKNADAERSQVWEVRSQRDQLQQALRQLDERLHSKYVGTQRVVADMRGIVKLALASAGEAGKAEE